MGLLGGPAEPPVRSQDPDAHAERPACCLLPVEASRPVRIRDEDGEAHATADLVHPARKQQTDISLIKVKIKREDFGINQKSSFPINLQ